MRFRRGKPLHILFAIFALSAVVRTSAYAPVAFAQEPTEKASEPEDAQLQTKQATAMSKDEGESLIQLLRSKQVELKKREEDYTKRKNALDLVEESIEKRIRDLENAEARLRKTIAQANGAAEGDLQHLTQVYQNMKPGDAAKLFGKMKPNFAAGFLGRMNPETAAAILSNLDPEAAFAISAILAGRNVNTPIISSSN